MEKVMLRRVGAVWFGLVIISAGVRSLIYHPTGATYIGRSCVGKSLTVKLE
jgi:hypothetical protein